MRYGHFHTWLLVGAGVLLIGGFVVGSVPVGGLYDSESFHCGSPFFIDNSEGYQGTDGFAACRRTAHSRLPLALALMGSGAGIAVLAWMLRRRARNRADQEWLARLGATRGAVP